DIRPSNIIAYEKDDRLNKGLKAFRCFTSPLLISPRYRRKDKYQQDNRQKHGSDILRNGKIPDFCRSRFIYFARCINHLNPLFVDPAVGVMLTLVIVLTVMKCRGKKNIKPF